MPLFQVRDRVSQKTVWVYHVSILETDVPALAYHTNAPQNADFPNGVRCAHEIEQDLNFIGPLEPPFGFFGVRLYNDRIEEYRS